jgi:hypothetical protein
LYNNTMATHTTTSVAADRSRGRGYLWLGILLAVLAIGLTVLQYALRLLIMPWHLPILTTLGALLVVLALARRGSVTRVLVLLLVVALAGFEWWFVALASKLPSYQGPARAGEPAPAFQTTLADGSSFTEQDLRDGQPTVMTFFRGRW